ncbi:uncharacterized protein LOC143038194 [Oratosquilla oratoria]|uniref:uncharacterized protein LOC143038194 n=1 Tax=Oratosquilla oratoria TaxID=337810 RepID=UPI003F7752CC
MGLLSTPLAAMKTSLLLMLVVVSAVALAAPQGAAPSPNTLSANPGPTGQQGAVGAQGNVGGFPSLFSNPAFYFALDDYLEGDFHHVVRGSDGLSYFIDVD